MAKLIKEKLRSTTEFESAVNKWLNDYGIKAEVEWTSKGVYIKGINYYDSSFPTTEFNSLVSGYGGDYKVIGDKILVESKQKEIILTKPVMIEGQYIEAGQTLLIEDRPISNQKYWIGFSKYNDDSQAIVTGFDTEGAMEGFLASLDFSKKPILNRNFTYGKVLDNQDGAKYHFNKKFKQVTFGSETDVLSFLSTIKESIVEQNLRMDFSPPYWNPSAIEKYLSANTSIQFNSVWKGNTLYVNFRNERDYYKAYDIIYGDTGSKLFKEEVVQEEEIEETNKATAKCPTCGNKYLIATGYCLTCKKKVKKESVDESYGKSLDDEVADYINYLIYEEGIKGAKKIIYNIVQGLGIPESLAREFYQDYKSGKLVPTHESNSVNNKKESVEESYADTIKFVNLLNKKGFSASTIDTIYGVLATTLDDQDIIDKLKKYASSKIIKEPLSDDDIAYILDLNKKL